MSDAIDTTFMDGHGPSYSVRALSKVTGRPYWETAYNQLRAHVTQYKPQLELLAATNDAGREQMLTNAPPGDALIEPLRLVRGKSLVGGSPTGDVFEAVAAGTVPYAAPPGFRPAAAGGVTLSLGGPWSFYRRFWQAHGLEILTSIDLLDVGPVSAGDDLRIPLLITNATENEQRVSVSATLPQGWQEKPRFFDAVVVPANSDAEFASVLVAGPEAAGGVVTVSYALEGVASPTPLTVRMVVKAGGNPLPQ